MADIAQDAELNRDDTLLEGAGKLLSYLWRVAWENAPGTVDGDADALHDMRVAVRRLRTLLKNLEGAKEDALVAGHVRAEMKELRARLNKAGDRLGAVRDFDVLRDYLEDYASKRLKMPVAASPGLAMFERYLQTGRAAAFGPMVKSVNRAQRPAGLREEFARFALGLPAALPLPRSLETTARLILSHRLDEALTHAGVLDDAQDTEGQHELRKSLKRVRYTLEAFAPCYDKDVKPFLKTLVRLQDRLGEMNDRTVLREQAEKATDAAGEEGLPDDLEQFLIYGENRRRRLLTQVRADWNTQRDEGFFDDLRGLTVDAQS